jgi:calcium-dependent protein kinase
MYMAPEVIKKEPYDGKCDIWSVGVILYILLVGSPPFGGKSESKIMENVLKGAIDMSGREWRTVSGLARDLVANMMSYDPNERPTADECLRHPFIADKIKHSFTASVFSCQSLENMRTFQAEQKLQTAVATFIAA